MLQVHTDAEEASAEGALPQQSQAAYLSLLTGTVICLCRSAAEQRA